MFSLSASATITFALLTVATCQRSCTSCGGQYQLPCDNQLRLLPEFAHLFTHCDCTYSEWSEWSIIRSTSVPQYQCDSERALIEERRRTVLNGSCEQGQEERTICKYYQVVCM